MFKTFPEFSKLTLADKEEYERFIRAYPPIADLSFASLVTWWNSFDKMQISLLNGNLVIPYWVPGDEDRAGFCLIGTNKIDESLCTIFDYLKEKDEPARLVNVPEFVIENIQYPELFSCTEERSYEDYILAVSRFYPLENMVHYRRKRVERILAKTGEDKIEVRNLDLRDINSKRLLKEVASKWWERNITDFGRHEKDAMFQGIDDATEIGMQNICLFIDGKLCGFCLFQYPADKDYIIISHAKAASKNLLGFELMAHLFAKWFSERGIKYMNINSDAGILPLRTFMLTLGPVNFFRKYRIEPKAG